MALETLSYHKNIKITQVQTNVSYFCLNPLLQVEFRVSFETFSYIFLNGSKRNAIVVTYVNHKQRLGRLWLNYFWQNFAYCCTSVMHGSIDSKPAHSTPPSPPQGDFLTSPSPQWGIRQRRSSWGGALSKTTQLGPSDFKSSIWFCYKKCKYLHNCFHLRTWDDRKKNVHGTWKSYSFIC